MKITENFLEEYTKEELTALLRKVENAYSKKEIRIRYTDPRLERLAKISKGDWIDLRAAEAVQLKAGEFKLISLGVAMELPAGYEATVVPRSSTFKSFGILMTNSTGVIDNVYRGNTDIWRFPAYATRDTMIRFGDRICQFRIQENQPTIEFKEVEDLGNDDRGGFGTTGVNEICDKNEVTIIGKEFELDIERQVPKNGINTNANKPYSNMEEKLYEAFKKFSNRMPIEVYSNDNFDNCDEFMNINPKNIIGYATNFDDTHFHVKLNEYGYNMYKSLRQPAIQIASIIDCEKCKDDKPLEVWRVAKLQLSDRLHINEDTKPENYR